MAHRLSETTCKVDIIRLSLSKMQIQQCSDLRLEAGRCYSDMIAKHVESRSDKWLSVSELKVMFKRQYQIHSQSIQAIAEKIDANIESARSNRNREMKLLGRIETEYPYQPKKFYTVTWKQLGIQIKDERIHLSNGLRCQPLVLDLPLRFRSQNITNAELVWTAGVFYLHITVDTGIVNLPLLRLVKTAGVDLGEIHIAACTVEDGKTIVISGRQLRSVKQIRNKRHAVLRSKMDRAEKSSRRWKAYKHQQARATAKFTQQQRDILHKASRLLIEFCVQNNVAIISIGDVRDIADGVNLGKKCNQKLSQWAHGLFVQYVTYKARVNGINIRLDDEAYSSKTCSVCGNVKSSSVKGRTYKCSACHSIVHRDANGSANICSKARYGRYSKVQVTTIKYLRPVKAGRSRPLEARLAA